MTIREQGIATFYPWNQHFIVPGSREPVASAESIRQIARKKSADYLEKDGRFDYARQIAGLHFLRTTNVVAVFSMGLIGYYLRLPYYLAQYVKK